MSRAERRADNAARARFKRKTGGTIISHLFEAGERIDGRPHADIVSRAVTDFYREPSGACFSCRSSIGRPSAFLVAHAAHRPRGAALAYACSRCWGAENYLTALSDAAEASLSKLVPGRWLSPLPVLHNFSDPPPDQAGAN